MNSNRTSTSNKRGERGQARLATLGALAAIVTAVLIGASVARDALADPASPLSITKTANPSPVASGGQLTYTITMTNTGGSKLSDLVMTDQVNGVGVIQTPPALPQLQITSTQGTCTQGGPNGNVVTCNGGTLPGRGTWTVTIRGQVTAANGATLNNTASVTGTRSAQTFSTSATVQVLVDGGTGGGDKPDLTINKKGPSSVAASSPLTYTLTVNNIGPSPATNVRVVDTVPAGVSGISASGTSLFVCGIVGQTVTCDGGAVNAGANATITIDGTSPAVAGTITNTAVVDPDNTIAESNELNNTSAVVYTDVGLPPSAPLLDIKKTDGNPAPDGTWWTGAGPDPVTPGQQITYKIQVTNNATGNNSRADDVIVTDGTQGLEASSIIATQVVVNGAVGHDDGCVVTAPQVRCSIRSLDSGGTLTITITGTVISSAGSTIFNTATVTGNIKNTGVTNTASEATTVKPAIDLTITKADNPDPVCARSWPIDGIPFPPGPPGSQHLPLSAAAPPAAGSPTELLAPPVCLGGLTYSFVVGNSGIVDATGVVVRDPLPNGLVFDSYDSDAGFVCAVDASNVVTCTAGAIPAESVRNLVFRVVAPPSLGTITNTVYVDPNNAIFEPDETNNTFVQSTDVVTGVDLVVWKSDSVNSNPPGDDAEGAPTLIPGDGVAPGSGLGDGFDPIATSGTETVTIYVDNVGTQDTTGIRLRDTLPAGTRFLSVMEVPGGSNLGPGPGTLHGFTCSHDGSPTGGVVECVGGHLLGTESEFYEEAGAPAPPPPGDHFATIKIRFFARPEVGSMHNEVRVDPLNEIAEVNELNNLATDETLVTVGNNDKGAYQQLGVVKTHASPALGTVATNGTLIYNLDVTNYGTDPVSNIVLVDTLPAGTRYIEAKDTDTGTDAFFCSHDGSPLGGVITCVGGDLDGSLNTIPVGGIARRVTVKVFAPDTPGTYTNLATVDPNNLVPEGNEFDNDAQLSTLVAPCVGQANCTATNAFNELTIAKTQFSPASPTSVATNGVITYDLLVTNLGSDPVYGVVVSDTLPAGSRFIDAQDMGGALDPFAFSCAEPDATNTLACLGGTLDGTIDTLGPGVPQERTIRIRIFAPNTPATYPNQSKVDPWNAVPEGNEFNNTSNLNTSVTPCVGQAACTAANAFYELTIDKTQNRPTIARNGVETFSLLITNLGSDPVFDIVVQDDLPEGSILIDAKDTAGAADPDAFTCGEPNASGILTCTGGDLSGTVNALAGIPTARTIEIRVFMPNTPGVYPNQAFVDPFNAIPEGNEFNNSDSLTTDVQNGGPTPYIDLTVDKTNPAVLDQDTGGPDGIVRVTPGHLIMYVLKVANGGEGDAFNVTVRDSLPANTTYHSALDTGAAPGQFSCGLVPGEMHTLECTGGTVPAGGSRTINVFVVAPTNLDQTASDLGDIQQLITNNALVDPANAIPEGDEANNADIVRTQVLSQINLTADKQGPDNAQQNQEDDYTITVKNEKVWGDGDIAVDAVVVDTLPVGLIPLSVTTSAANFLCSIEENPVNVVTCVGDLEPEQQVTITVHVFITQESGQMYNQVCIDPNHTIDETNELDNCDVKTTNVGAPTPTPEPAIANLNINKSASSSVVEPGQNLTYTVSVSNTGTGTAADVTIRDDLSALPVTFVSAVATNGFTCVEAAAVVTCTDGGSGLAAGSNTVVTIEVTVNADAAAAFTNTAMVDDADPFVTAVDTASVMTNVGAAGIDLVVASYTDSPDPVPQGDSVTFTAVVTNAGTADTTTDPAPNTVVVQTLFDSNTGLSVASATASQGFSCDSDLSDFMIECTGDLASGDSTIVTIVLQTSGTSPASLNSIVFVDPADDILEASELNNFDSQVTTISGSICSSCVDLVLSGPLESATSVSVGDTLTYTITVGNIGDTSTDTGPGDQVLIFFDLSGSGGATFSAPVYSTTAGFGCSLTFGNADTALSDCKGELGPGQGTIITITVTATASGTITAMATADPLDTISEFLETNNGPGVEDTTVNP
jgi:uncharacterized repeat protein (TIGR01451 family)